MSGLRFLGKLLHDPNLFHLNRHSVSVAFFAGIFICMLPVPGQLILAGLAAFVLRCNLPITFTLIWISNPLTFPIIFFGAYKLGVMMLGLHPEKFTFEFTWQWLTTGFLNVWQPLVLGCVTAGLFFGSLGYVIVQWAWRWHVVDRWQRRKLRHASVKKPPPNQRL